MSINLKMFKEGKFEYHSRRKFEELRLAMGTRYIHRNNVYEDIEELRKMAEEKFLSMGTKDLSGIEVGELKEKSRDKFERVLIFLAIPFEQPIHDALDDIFEELGLITEMEDIIGIARGFGDGGLRRIKRELIELKEKEGTGNQDLMRIISKLENNLTDLRYELKEEKKKNTELKKGLKEQNKEDSNEYKKILEELLNKNDLTKIKADIVTIKEMYKEIKKDFKISSDKGIMKFIFDMWEKMTTGIGKDEIDKMIQEIKEYREEEIYKLLGDRNEMGFFHYITEENIKELLKLLDNKEMRKFYIKEEELGVIRKLKRVYNPSILEMI